MYFDVRMKGANQEDVQSTLVDKISPKLLEACDERIFRFTRRLVRFL